MDKPSSLEQAFVDVYTKFKLQFYRKIFSRFETREASLTAVETFCVEVIGAMANNPTINEFAKFVNISQANAAYKIQSLIEKGYVIKKRSEADRREYRLSVTDKFHQYNSYNIDYVGVVSSRIRDRFSPEEIDLLNRALVTISAELMPEIMLEQGCAQPSVQR